MPEPYRGKRNDYPALSKYWAARAREAEAKIERLQARDQGRIEQDLENEQVRRLQRTGRCPVCGADA